MEENLRNNNNRLKEIHEEIEKIKYKEIRNIKVDSDFCIDEKKVYEDYTCLICTNIVENPVSCFHCESMFCRDCTENIYDKKCPNCREHFEEKNIGRFVKAQLTKLEFQCPLNCSKTINYEQKEKHFSECKNKNEIEPKCSICNMAILSNLEEHSKQCEKLKCECPFCNLSLSKLELNNHLNNCVLYEKYCDNCGTNYPCRFEDSHNEFFCKIVHDLKLKIRNFIPGN